MEKVRKCVYRKSSNKAHLFNNFVKTCIKQNVTIRSTKMVSFDKYFSISIQIIPPPAELVLYSPA